MGFRGFDGAGIAGRWAGLVAALWLLGATAPTRADDAIDCSATPFVFSGEGYFVDCLRIEARAAKDGASGQSQSDLISISSSDRTMFLTVVSRRLTAVHLYMRRQDLRANTRDFFSSVELNDWNGIGNKSGYDMAEFASDVSGQPSHCLALQRYLNPAYDGYKRHVIGIGCTSGDLAPVYDALAKLRAPGDD
ncbi:MAG TPA: hypothetical protein VG742_03445 [Dongiaceae bacterium]|nr:hypothetical protein [Dongiaceae bacterium]